MAKVKTTAAPIEVLDPEPADVELITTDGSVITAFLRDVARFFRGARVIERKATDLLAQAKATADPTTPEEDAVIQSNIRLATAVRKEGEEYWGGIAGGLHSLHRKVTAARGRGTTPAQEAADRWQRQHNAFVAEQERKRKAEEDRLRRLEQARAEEDRQRELDRLEEEALKAEASSEGLSARESAFVDLIDLGVAPSDAARQAGYRDARRGILLVAKPTVAAAIEAKRQARLVREQAAAVAAAPLRVADVSVARDVQKVGTDRTTWSGEVVDLDAFLAAALDPKLRLHYGITVELLSVNPVKLNELARSLEQNLDRIPGLRAVKNTRTI